MVYVVTAIIIAILWLPLVYELPNYVYGRRYAIKSFLRWHISIYITLFCLLTLSFMGIGIIMVYLTTTLTFKGARIWIGIVLGAACIVYFLRLIPIYYDEEFGVHSKTRYVGTFVREMVAIAFFGLALLSVSVYTWSYCVDAAVTALLFASRIWKFVGRRRGHKGKKK